MNVTALNKPKDFLEVVVHEISLQPGLSGLSVGYENKIWRADDFSKHVFKWLPEFALSWKEYKTLEHSNAVELLSKAAERTYTTKKFQNRGEFGELFLHIALRQIFDSYPVISKIFFKSARNDTVKGFDAVHVVTNNSVLELWLGEVKFYKDITSAIRDVVNEIQDHTQNDYLKDEFVLILDKIDDDWPYEAKLKELLNPNCSLDKVFDYLCVPVLLTYESKTVKAHNVQTELYVEELKDEITKHYDTFTAKNLPDKIKIHLFLLPLQDKEDLINSLDRGLKTWQSLS